MGVFAFVAPTRQKTDDNEVVFWTLQMSDFSDYMNKVITNFEKENPDIKIKWIDVPFSEGEKRTLASVLSNNPPDLINLNPDFAALLAQRGALFEIEEKYTSQFNKSIINSLKTDGKLYSLPWYATSAITIYNKDLLKKANVNLPATYEDISKIAPIIKDKTNKYVMLPNITENDTMVKILNKYGINSAENINSEKSQEVFNMFKNLYEKDLIPKESITQTHREALEKYMAENIVFFQAGANFLNLGQNDFSLMNFVIPSRAKHKQEALKFALYLTNKENQLELAKLTNVIAVNKETLKDNFYKEYEENDLMSKARVISANQLYNIDPPMKPQRNQKEINTLINTAVQEILINKNTTKNILDDVSIKYKKLIAD